MRPIVCATRGGEASRRTQERAIALAKERGAELIFLCVVDPNFVKPTNKALAAALRSELKRLGRALLYIAQARAKEQGVDAKAVVRSGPVRDTIEAYLREVDAGTLVIGAPRGETTLQALDPGQVDLLAEDVERELGIEIVIVV